MIIKFQKDPDSLTRLVTMDSDIKVTISEYYKGSKVNENDVYTLFHVVNIVLSCNILCLVIILYINA